METGSSEDLERRLALCGPEHTVRGFFFNAALEAVRALGDPAALERCVAAAGGERFLTFFSYPVGALNRLLYTAAWALSGVRGSFDAAMWHLGRQVAPDYLESGAGRVLVMLAGGEPRRMLNGFPAAFRTAIRHGECSVEWTEPHRATVIIQGTTMPTGYFEGAVHGVFESTQVARVKAVGRQVGVDGTEVEVSW